MLSRMLSASDPAVSTDHTLPAPVVRDHHPHVHSCVVGPSGSHTYTAVNITRRFDRSLTRLTQGSDRWPVVAENLPLPENPWVMVVVV